MRRLRRDLGRAETSSEGKREKKPSARDVKRRQEMVPATCLGCLTSNRLILIFAFLDFPEASAALAFRPRLARVLLGLIRVQIVRAGAILLSNFGGCCFSSTVAEYVWACPEKAAWVPNLPKTGACAHVGAFGRALGRRAVSGLTRRGWPKRLKASRVVALLHRFICSCMKQ